MLRSSLAAGVILDTRGAATVRAAEAAGFSHVGLWVDPTEWDAVMERDAKAALDATGIEVCDVEVIRIAPGPLDTDLLKILDAGAAVGAKHALAISADPDPGATAAKLAQLNEHAAPAGIRVVIEFMVFTAVRTIGDALDVVQRCGHPGAGILVDTLHLFRSGGTIAQLAAVDPALRPYAQLCDAPAEPPTTDPSDLRAFIVDALDARSCAGDGGLDVNGFVDAYPADTVHSLEIRSKELRERFPDPVERARFVAGRHAAFAATR